MVAKVLIIFFLSITSLHANPLVIILNGTSSAGKSTIAQLVCNSFDPNECMSISHDEIRRQICENRPDLSEGKIDNQADAYIFEKIKNCSQKKIIIVDAVLPGDNFVNQWRQELSGIEVKHILVYAGLHSIYRNTLARNERSEDDEKRSFIFSLHQYVHLYKKGTGQNDCIIDTLNINSIKNVLDNALQQQNKHNDNHHQKNDAIFKELYSQFLQRFQLASPSSHVQFCNLSQFGMASKLMIGGSYGSQVDQEISVTPDIAYDFIVVNQDPNQSANQVKNYIERFN